MAKQLAVEWMARRGELCLQPRHGKKNVLKSQYVDALLALTGEKALLLESFVAPLNWQEAAAPDSILNNLVDFMIGSTKDRTFKPARLSQAEQENLQQLKGTQEQLPDGPLPLRRESHTSYRQYRLFTLIYETLIPPYLHQVPTFFGANVPP